MEDVLVEAQFLGLSSGREAVDDVLVEAQFLGLGSGSQSLITFLWRPSF